MWQDFRTFIAQGNVMGLAIGIIIGGAFGTVVSTLVNNVVMPPIGLLIGRVDFSSLFINLSSHPYPSYAAAEAAGAPVIAYGLFVNSLVDFFIVALVIFFAIRWLSKLQKHKSPTTSSCPYCLSTIPVKATRCPQCTSTLAPASPPSQSSKA